MSDDPVTVEKDTVIYYPKKMEEDKYMNLMRGVDIGHFERPMTHIDIMKFVSDTVYIEDCSIIYMSQTFPSYWSAPLCHYTCDG